MSPDLLIISCDLSQSLLSSRKSGQRRHCFCEFVLRRGRDPPYVLNISLYVYSGRDLVRHSFSLEYCYKTLNIALYAEYFTLQRPLTVVHISSTTMKLSSCLLASSASLVFAQKPVEGGLATGPYKSGFYEDSLLPKHTIFAPVCPPAGLKLPILIWSNGGCSGNGTLFRRSLWEVASHGKCFCRKPDVELIIR